MESSFPKNGASPYEQEKLDNALDSIQADFDKEGIEINLRKLPFSVADLRPGTGGQCHFNISGKSKGIVISHKVFDLKELEGTRSFLHHTLLHEIGHCFFKRKHEESCYRLPGYEIMLWSTLKGFAPNSFVEKSVMDNKCYSLFIPDEIWPYYIKEIAGLDRLETWEDLKAYTDVKIQAVADQNH